MKFKVRASGVPKKTEKLIPMKNIKLIASEIVKKIPFLKPRDLRIAEEKRKMQRELQDQGHSRAAAMRAVSEHFSKIEPHHEK